VNPDEPYSRERHIEAACKARDLMDAAGPARTGCMVATVVNGLVCLAIGYGLVSKWAAVASVAGWAYWFANAVVKHRDAHKALRELNRLNREAP
jgi:hypothetical protein